MTTRKTHHTEYMADPSSRRLAFGHHRGDAGVPRSRDILGKLTLAVVVAAIVGLELLLGLVIYSEITGTAATSIPLAQSAPPIALGILVTLAVLAVLSRKGT